MVMKDTDLEYLRNVNTKPGPNAGHSIDPSKPGPDNGLAQSDAEPVAWQYRFHIHGEWIAWKETLNPKYWRKQTGTEVRPLYTAPPRPDASAGLIEATAGNLYRGEQSDAEPDYIPIGGAGNGA